MRTHSSSLLRCLAFAPAVAPFLVAAQVSLYSFSQSVEPYTDITADDGGYSLGVPTFWPPLFNERAWVNTPFYEPNGQVASYLNPAIGPGYPIGFDFPFNGDVFDRLSVSHSGFITFGKSSDGDQAVWTYAINHSHARPFVQSYGGPSEPYKRNRVAGWASSGLYMQDRSQLLPPGPVTSLRVATIGTAPNRVCVVQWKDFLSGYPPNPTQINFQIRLNESDNSVEVRFGNMVYAGGEVQVGLGGRLPEDFNSRMTVSEQPAFLYDWNNTVAGLLNTDACSAVSAQPGQPNGSGVPPVNGRTYKWTPATCPPPAWPLTISNISFQGFTASWPENGSAGVDYFLSTENDINGPEVASGYAEGTELYLDGLEPMTTYYLFVRSYCDGEPGPWSVSTTFLTHGGGVLACPDTPEEVTYCTRQYSTVYWHYMSEDGFSPVKLEFLGGFAGNQLGESLQIWNGGSASGTPDWTAPSGDLEGHVFTATSGQLFIRAVNDIGSCESQPWYLPFHWRVGCKNCTEPLVQVAMGEVDCEAQEYFVTANVFSLGTSVEVVLENNLGVAPTTVSATGEVVLGPFLTGESVTITSVNTDNMLCNVVYAPLENEPCAIVDCGPTWYEECTTQNEVETWLFEGEGQPVSVRFLPATLGWDADVLVHTSGVESADPETILGATNNEVISSQTPANRILVQLIASQYAEYECSEGLSQPLEFVVGCASACEQPTATFAYAECTQPSTYSVVVNVTDLGSTGSVTITNDGGAPSVPVSAIGTYTVGPFPSGSNVRVHVEGADAICSWSSTLLNYSCLQMGVAEVATLPLRVFPNPSDGHLRLVLPGEMTAGAQLQVLDLAGRTVAQRFVNGTGEMVLGLGELPNGLYTLLLRDGQHSATGKISIQH